MEVAQDGSGWMMLSAVVMRQTLCSVDMQDGEHTTVITLRTSQYRVSLTQQRNTQVSN